jgi:L-lactate dehydrogenase (cytochrome)
MTPIMLDRCAVRPAWTLATLRYGQPRFRGLEKYIDRNDLQKMLTFIGQGLGGTLDWDYLQALRDEWHGALVLKGVLDVEEARRAVALGFDGILVSNHGGRQFDGAPAAISALPAIAAAVGDKVNILFDSGVRNGLDIARALALGADFVLLGRAVIYGVAALGERGGDHVADILLADLKNNMAQLGCMRIDELKDRV